MPLGPERIDAITSAMGHSRVLILGDAMVDEYLLGSVSRISPEAPVPVVDIETTRQQLGGAANVAANIKALGDEPLLLCVVGEDEGAGKLRDLLRTEGISSELLIPDDTRKTTIKTRVIAHSQQVVRADQETRHGLSAAIGAVTPH